MSSPWDSFRTVLIDLAWERGQKGDWQLWLRLLEEQARTVTGDPGPASPSSHQRRASPLTYVPRSEDPRSQEPECAPSLEA